MSTKPARGDEAKSLAKKVFRNSVYLLAGSLISAIIAFLLNAEIARYLRETFFGNYTLVFVHISFFIVLSHLSIDSILTRELSKRRGQGIGLISSTFLLKTVISAVAMLLCVVIGFLMPYENSVRLGIIFASLTLIFTSYVMTFNAILQSRLKMAYSTIGLLASRLVFASLIFLVIRLNGGFVMLTIASLIAVISQFLLMLLFSGVEVKKLFKIDKASTFLLLKESWPLAITALMIVIYFKIDVVILKLYRGSAEVGIYSAAYMISEATTMIAVAFSTTLFPVLSSYYYKSVERFKKMYELSFKLLFSVALPTAVGMALIPSSIIGLVYRGSYTASAALLPVLGVAAALISMNCLFSSVVVAINKQRENMVIPIILVIISICANLLLIPSLGPKGAAITGLIVELLCAILTAGLIYISTKKSPLNISTLKIVFSSMVMGLLVYLLKGQLMIFLLVPLAALVYAIACILSGVFRKNELELIRSIFVR